MVDMSMFFISQWEDLLRGLMNGDVLMDTFE